MFSPYASVATNLLFFEKGSPTKDIWYYEHRLPDGQKSYSKTKPVKVAEFDPIKRWWEDRQESDVSWKVSIDAIIKRGWDLDIKNPFKNEDEITHTTSELLEMLHASFRKSEELLKKLKKELV